MVKSLKSAAAFILERFSGPGLRAQLGRANGIAIALKLISTLLGFATTVMLARLMGPESFGVYAFALAMLTVLGMPVKAGIPQLVTRETARGQATGNWGIVKAVWRWATIVVVVTSLVLLVVAAMAAWLLPEKMSTELFITLSFGVLTVPLMSLALVRSSSLRGLGNTVEGQLPELVAKPIVLVSMLTLFPLVSSSVLDAATAMAMNLIATAAAFFFGTSLLWRVWPSSLKNVKAQYESRAWLSAIIPMASINAMHLINTQADILLLGLFMGKSDVGEYKIAAQLSLIVAFGLQATKMVIEPFFSRFYYQRKFEHLQRLAKATCRLNFAIGISVFGSLLILGSTFLEFVFGPAFASSFVPMLVLSGARLFGSSLGSSGYLLNMAGFHREYSRFWIASALINIVLNLWLIPIVGTVGAAIATAVSLVFPHALGWWAAKKWIGCDCSPF